VDCGIQSEQAKDLYIDRYNISLYMVGKISEAGEFVSWNKKNEDDDRLTYKTVRLEI